MDVLPCRTVVCRDVKKLQVSFGKRATNYRALLRKMTCRDKASCGSSPPCRTIVCRDVKISDIKAHVVANYHVWERGLHVSVYIYI